MQVSNLAAAAAQEINANAQLVRTGALYHDLGKMQNPAYFTENQANGQNPLDQMETEKAAKIIVDHVNNGLKLANQYHLPKVVKDFIATHHGTDRHAISTLSTKTNIPTRSLQKKHFIIRAQILFLKRQLS